MSDLEVEASPESTPTEEPTEESAPDPEGLEEEQALTDEVTAVRRALAVVKSGIDLDHPMGKVFVAALEKSEHWQDSVWTPEEIRATARVHGVAMREG